MRMNSTDMTDREFVAGRNQTEWNQQAETRLLRPTNQPQTCHLERYKALQIKNKNSLK